MQGCREHVPTMFRSLLNLRNEMLKELGLPWGFPLSIHDSFLSKFGTLLCITTHALWEVIGCTVLLSMIREEGAWVVKNWEDFLMRFGRTRFLVC